MLKGLVPKTHMVTQLRELMHLEDFSLKGHLSDNEAIRKKKVAQQQL